MKKIEELPEQQTPADIPAPEDETAVDNTVEEAAESVAETDRSPEEDTPKEDTPKED